MELKHSFTVPVPVDRAWDVLLDVERVAPCMPGATLDSVDGDDITGKIKVKVGPISMVYAGKAHFTERNREAGVVTLEASGKETRGAGTAGLLAGGLEGDHAGLAVALGEVRLSGIDHGDGADLYLDLAGDVISVDRVEGGAWHAGRHPLDVEQHIPRPINWNRNGE